MRIYILIILGILFHLNTYSQVNAEIVDILVNNQTTINNCNLIDMEDNNNISLTIYFKLTKPSAQALGTTNVKALLKFSSSSDGDEKGSYSVENNSWSNNDTEFFGQIPISIAENEIQTVGSSVLVRSITNSNAEDDSCEYDIEKDEVPGFSISPTSETVVCGNASSKTFSVIPENIPAGSNVVYQWNIGNGWLYQGNAVSSFTTTTPTVQLTPFNFPPNNVRVTPVLDGVSYPELTSSVSLGNFNPAYPIDGSAFLCDTGLYTIAGLPSDTTILSASTSDASVATASLVNNQITLTKVSDGSMTLSVALENSCSQTATITKTIQVGIPSSVFNAEVTGDTVICGTQNYTYSLNVSHPCVNQVVWELSGNLNLVSQSNSAITVAQDPSNTEAAGFIKATIPGTSFESTKGVWVGLPVTNALSITKVGAYNFYTGRWTKLRSNYGPLAYESNQEPQTITYEWIIPSSYVRNFADTAFKDVRPFSTGQLNIGVRAENECGCSTYKYQLFEVIQEDDGGGYTGPGLTPVD